MRLEVRPEDASVYVDDRFRGTAREARSLRLNPGRHTIELVRPGFAVERRRFFPLPFLPLVAPNLCIGLVLRPQT